MHTASPTACFVRCKNCGSPPNLQPFTLWLLKRLFLQQTIIRQMESADLIQLLERLDDDVDDLEEAIAPILQSTVVETSKKLPVLDKAKFHVMTAYALESLIFCMDFAPPRN